MYLYNVIYNKQDIRLLGYKQPYTRLLNYKLYIKELVLRALYIYTLAKSKAQGLYIKASFILLFLPIHLLILALFKSRHLALIYKTLIYESRSLKKT
jgi:hypothetical protein